MSTATRVYDIGGNAGKLYSITTKGVFYCNKPAVNWILDTRFPAYSANVEMNNNHCIILSFDKTFMSNDNGLTFNVFVNHLSYPTFGYKNIVASDSTGYYICATDKGTAHYPWADSNFSVKSYGLTKNHSLSIYKSGPSLLLSTIGGGIYSSPNLGVNWNIHENELLGIVVNSIIHVDSILAAATSQGVYYSPNNGNNWVTSTNLLSGKNIQTICTFQPWIFAGTSSSVYRKMKNGTIWTTNNAGLNDSTINFLYTKENVLYACTNAGVSVYDTVLQTWHAFNNFPQNHKVYSFIKSGNLFMAGSDLEILISSDNGVSWVSSLPGLKTNVLAPSDADIVAGTSNGVYAYLKYNQSWRKIFPYSSWIYDVSDIVVSDSVMYGASSLGFFTVRLNSGVFTTISDKGSPQKFTLYPNPFTTSVSVDLHTDHPGNVLINIYTPAGIRVYSTLIKNPGRKILLDNFNLSATGLYLIRVTCDDYSDTELIYKN